MRRPDRAARRPICARRDLAASGVEPSADEKPRTIQTDKGGNSDGDERRQHSCHGKDRRQGV
jgi:hypothetical protein